MAFWDQHDPGSGSGGYLTPEEKEDLVNDETPFEITGVRFEQENKFGPRFVVSLVLPDQATGDNETRLVGFPQGSGATGRDNVLQAMMDDHFGAGDKTPIPCILAKGGRAFVLLPAPEAKKAKKA